MNEVSIISTVAICVCGAFITGSVAFVIKSLMNVTEYIAVFFGSILL